MTTTPPPPTVDRRTHVIRFIIGGLAGALAMAIIVAVLVAATKSTQIRQTQESSQVPTILARVEACTTPGQDCYERSRRQLANAVTDVNKVVILAAACASGPTFQNVAQIQACVIRRLAAQHPRHR